MSGAQPARADTKSHRTVKTTFCGAKREKSTRKEKQNFQDHGPKAMGPFDWTLCLFKLFWQGPGHVVLHAA